MPFYVKKKTTTPLRMTPPILSYAKAWGHYYVCLQVIYFPLYIASSSIGAVTDGSHTRKRERR